MPAVSVIIPAFNAADHIAEAIYSALAQTVCDLEVVVVDDGSNDATAAAVAAIDDSRVRLVRQANQGQSAAINAGVAQSRGAHIKLLDADDWLNPKHLEAQLRALDGYTDHVASCRWGYFVDNPARTAVRDEAVQRSYEEPLEWLVDSLTLDEGMMGGWMWLIPRSLAHRAGGFDNRLSLNNDFHFSIKLLLKSEGVRFAPDAVYSYRKGVNGALSGSAGREAMESAWLTTELGTQLLLQREDTPRVRRICADRLQQWLFRFHPEYPDLAAQAERRVAELGGSDLVLPGGPTLRALGLVLGWKATRRIQAALHRTPWQRYMAHKARQRLQRLAQAPPGTGHGQGPS